MDLEKLLKGIADTVTEYVTDKASGNIIGAIIYRDGWHYLCAGHDTNTEAMVACRRFRKRSSAQRGAAAILNDGRAVNVAAIF